MQKVITTRELIKFFEKGLTSIHGEWVYYKDSDAIYRCNFKYNTLLEFKNRYSFSSFEIEQCDEKTLPFPVKDDLGLLDL